MTDSTLRELEREYASDPSDKILLERLQDERRRRGFGWWGEQKPGKLLCTTERGVYVTEQAIELVYVPGGEVECECRHSPSADFTNTAETIDFLTGRNPPCSRCNATGKRLLKPYYIGRYPVTNAQYLACLMWGGARRENGTYRTHDAWAIHDWHPRVNVSLEDAKSFCEWAGLRLPTEAEWKWAALGDGLPSLDAASPEPWKTGGKTPRRYPWGNNPPSPKRCVWAGHPYYGPSRNLVPRFVGESFDRLDFNPGSTAPVVEWLCPSPSRSKTDYIKPKSGLCVADGWSYPAHEHTPRCKLVPARPLGSSWCGAQDMAGNVWEWTSDDALMGGSFRDFDLSMRRSTNGSPNLEARDDVGFRVALNAIQ